MLNQLNCKFLGHKIERYRVWHDGLDHRTSCRRCGSPMIKSFDTWRVFVPDKDTDLRRKPHPRYDQVSA